MITYRSGHTTNLFSFFSQSIGFMIQFFRQIILVRSRIIAMKMLPAVSDKIIAGCKSEGRGISNNDAHHLKRHDAGSVIVDFF